MTSRHRHSRAERSSTGRARPGQAADVRRSPTGIDPSGSAWSSEGARRRRAAPSLPASSTSTRTTTRRCSGTPRCGRRRSTASPPWWPATAVSRSRRRVRSTTTHRGTLENVEDMDPATLRRGSPGTSRRSPSTSSRSRGGGPTRDTRGTSRSPRRSPGECRGVHVLDVLERAHDGIAVLRSGGRDREPAVAGHHGGDALVGRRPQRGVPEHLRVVVRVDVDEAGSDRAARRVQLAATLQVRSDLTNRSALDGHIGHPTRCAAPVVDGSTAYDEVSWHLSFLSRISLVPCPRVSTLWAAPAVVRPSTGSTIPVTWAERSLARYTTAFATSVGEPMRCSGCMSPHDLRPGRTTCSCPSGMWAGATQFTLPRARRTSTANTFGEVYDRSLRGAIRHESASAFMPPIEVVLMIEPRPSSAMWRVARSASRPSHRRR